MERYQVRTVKALVEDPEAFSISTLALSTANRVTRTDCRQGDNLGASSTLACVNNEQVERTDRADTQIGSDWRWCASVSVRRRHAQDAFERLLLARCLDVRRERIYLIRTEPVQFGTGGENS